MSSIPYDPCDRARHILNDYIYFTGTSLVVWFGRANEVTLKDPGGRLNKRDGLTRYGNSHVKDKTS